MRFQNLGKVILLFFILFLTSCVEDQEFLALKREVYSIKNSISRIDRRISALKEEQREGKGELGSRVDLISKEIEEIKGALRENEERMDNQYYTLAKKIEKIEEEIREIKWDIKVLKSVKESVEISGEAAPSNATFPSLENRTESPQDLYSKALDAYRRGEIKEARELFNTFLAKYPEDELSDNALFWLGETYYVEGRYPEAIVRYQKVLVRYPNGDKVPSALLKLGFAQLKLGNRIDAKVTFEKLIKNYPETTQARIAEKELKKLQGK